MPTELWISKHTWWYTRAHLYLQDSEYINGHKNIWHQINVWKYWIAESHLKTILLFNEKKRTSTGGARKGLLLQPTRGYIPGPQFPAAAAAGSGSSTLWLCTVAGINIYIGETWQMIFFLSFVFVCYSSIVLFAHINSFSLSYSKD